MTAHAIRLEGLEKSFTLGMGLKKRVALDKLDLSVSQGEIYGFLGPNGAGKTTSIKVLASLLRQDAGRAQIFGHDPGEKKSRSRLGFLPESPIFYDHLTGREFLRFCGRLAGMARVAIESRAGMLLERVDLSHAADLQIRKYSKGMNQRIGIAQSLIHDPELVILDEPMSGLDPMGRAEIRDLIRDLKREGKTVFFSTHIIPDVEIICDRIGLVNHGRMIAEGHVADLLRAARGTTTDVLAEGLSPDFGVPGINELGAPAGQRLFAAPSDESLASLLGRVLERRGRVVSVTPRRESLEDLVVRLLSREERAAA